MKKKDFIVVTDFMMRLKMGRRIHLCQYEVDSLAEGLDSLFERTVDVARVKHGRRQTIDTLIGEEALLFAKYLRNERKEWTPRLKYLDYFVDKVFLDNTRLFFLILSTENRTAFRDNSREINFLSLLIPFSDDYVLSIYIV
jgi:hypothetical protein